MIDQHPGVTRPVVAAHFASGLSDPIGDKYYLSRIISPQIEPDPGSRFRLKFEFRQRLRNIRKFAQKLVHQFYRNADFKVCMVGHHLFLAIISYCEVDKPMALTISGTVTSSAIA